MKKLLSVIMAVVMLLSAFAVGASAAGYDDWKTGLTDIPNIYIQGQGAELYDSEGNVLYGRTHTSLGGVVTDEPIDLTELLNDYMPDFKAALLNGEWEPYNEKIVALADKIYGKIALDENGNSKDGVHHVGTYDYISESYTDHKGTGGKYALRGYNFYIDWRIDPFETADLLNDYIKTVLASTGKSKVNLTSRCEGCNIVAAYLDKYGTDDVNCCCFYINTVYGCDDISCIFSGDFSFDGESISRYKDLENLSIGDDELVNELIDRTLAVLVDTYSVDALTLAATPLVQKIYEETLTKFLLHSYATMPGIWAIIGKQDYARAKKYIFKGVEDEYAGLIAKLDYYDAHVRQRADELFKKAEADGAKIQFIGKYGDYAMYPISEASREYSDGSVILAHSAPGATVAKYGKTLSKKYIEKAEAKGNGEYISADRVVDCSTCLFPETTWVIHNSEHRDFPWCIHEIIADFFASDGTMTVSNQERFPQFMHYVQEGSRIVPLTAENGAQKQPVEHTKTTIREKIAAFVRFFIDLFKKIASGELKLSEELPI